MAHFIPLVELLGDPEPQGGWRTQRVCINADKIEQIEPSKDGHAWITLSSNDERIKTAMTYDDFCLLLSQLRSI